MVNEGFWKLSLYTCTPQLHEVSLCRFSIGLAMEIVMFNFFVFPDHIILGNIEFSILWNLSFCRQTISLFWNYTFLSRTNFAKRLRQLILHLSSLDPISCKVNAHKHKDPLCLKWAWVYPRNFWSFVKYILCLEDVSVGGGKIAIKWLGAADLEAF